MIIRIVKLTFEPEYVPIFLNTFKEYKDRISSSEGCERLELLNDINSPNVFMTYSYWLTEDHLNSYRKSLLFKEVWTKTKALFADKPAAWSMHTINP